MTIPDAAWAALHRGTEREGLDSPSHFELGKFRSLQGIRRLVRSPNATAGRPAAPPPGPLPPAPSVPSPHLPLHPAPAMTTAAPLAADLPADLPARMAVDTVPALTPVPPGSVMARPPAIPVPGGGRRAMVRPYARTGGRTRPGQELALETLVSTTVPGRRYEGVTMVPQRIICDLCTDTRSVAEIAAHLVLPLGVVKVLVGDMAEGGLLQLHRTGLMPEDQVSQEFMARVLSGLRAL